MVVMEGGRALHAKNGAAGGRWYLQRHPVLYERVTPEHPHPCADAAFRCSCLASHLIPTSKVCSDATGTNQAVKCVCGLCLIFFFLLLKGELLTHPMLQARGRGEGRADIFSLFLPKYQLGG